MTLDYMMTRKKSYSMSETGQNSATQGEVRQKNQHDFNELIDELSSLVYLFFFLLKPGFAREKYNVTLETIGYSANLSICH